MTEDFVVSCWQIPVQGRRSHSGYLALLNTYAESLDGIVFQEGSELLVLVEGFSLAPGDTLCRYRSGRFGVKRGGK